jgi:hypothetical protein
MIDKALAGATTTLEEIAAAGVTYSTLYAWRTGARPNAPRTRPLADAIEKRSNELGELAAEIRKAGSDGVPR